MKEKPQRTPPMTKDTITVPVMTADTPTRNNTVFPEGTLETIVHTFHERKEPLWGTLSGMDLTELRNASHQVIDLYVEDHILFAELLFLDNENGRKALAMLTNRPERFVFRPAGYGTLKKDEKGHGVIQGDFVLTCINIVSRENAI
jgi:hypothetical protein